MKTNMKKIVIALVVIIAIVSMSVLVLNVRNKQNNEKQEVSLNSFQITDFSIGNRVVLKKDNAIYIGNNAKELENSFCDIKIQNVENGVIVELNKLWYETYGEDYIEDNYLARICRELTYRLNVKGGSEQIEYAMYKYIKDNYMKVREGETVEGTLTDEINMKLVLEEQIVKLIIRGS